MVLQIGDKEPHNVYGEKFLPTLLNLVGAGNHSFEEATIDGNTAIVKVPFRGNVSAKLLPLLDHNSGIEFSYSSWKHTDNGSGGKGTPTFRFNLRSGVKPTYILEYKNGFHDTVDAIFGTRQTGGHNQRKTAETVGLEVPNSLEVSLEYTCHLGIWHAFPPEFFDYVAGFKFEGPYLYVEWPKLEHSSSGWHEPKRIPEEMCVGIDDFNFPHNKCEEATNRFIEQLLRTGLTERQTTQTNSRGFEQKFTKLLVSTKFNYNNMQELEELARQKPEGDYRPKSKATIKISGQVPRDTFFDIPDLRSMSVKGHVKAGGITINTHTEIDTRRFSKTPSVRLDHGTFEDISKLMKLSDFSSLYIEIPKEREYPGYSRYPLLEPPEEKK